MRQTRISQSWRQRLRAVFSRPSQAEMMAFLDNTVKPAIATVVGEMRNLGDIRAEIADADGKVLLTVDHAKQPNFLYSVQVRPYARPVFAVPEFEWGQPGARSSNYRAEVRTRSRRGVADITGYTQDQIIADIVTCYERHVAGAQPSARAEAA